MIIDEVLSLIEETTVGWQGFKSAFIPGRLKKDSPKFKHHMAFDKHGRLATPEQIESAYRQGRHTARLVQGLGTTILAHQLLKKDSDTPEEKIKRIITNDPSALDNVKSGADIVKDSIRKKIKDITSNSQSNTDRLLKGENPWTILKNQ